jgi:glycosyltransferase involved in cell wall biosynthesis
LFLGRFDRQKGLDRLAAIMRSSRELGLPIDWRVVGASLIDDAAQHHLERLLIDIESPKVTPEALTECYSWADVILTVSRWEGLPLTILEAMRLGTVVCTTAVGAVSEAVSQNETGFLLPSTGTGTIVRGATELLQRMCGDRDLLRRVSAAAAARSWAWENSAKDFLAQLDGLAAA